MCLILLSWSVGLLSGIFGILSTDFSPMMLAYSFERMSIVCHILMLSAPVLLSFILLRFSNFNFLLPIICYKAYSYTCCMLCFRVVYRAAGWLLADLMLFSDRIIVCILIWFWCSHVPGERVSAYAVLACLILVILTGCVDYYYVLPFVESLLN